MDNQQIPIVQLVHLTSQRQVGTKSQAHGSPSQLELCFPLTVSLTFLMTNLATICHSLGVLVLLSNVGCQRWSLKQTKKRPCLPPIPNTEDQIH